MRLRINPLPPLAYTITMAVMYVALFVGVANDITLGVGNATAAVASWIGASLAISGGIGGSRTLEVHGGVILALGVTGAFILSPLPSPVWSLWSYSTWAGSVAVLMIRWSYLCKH